MLLIFLNEGVTRAQEPNTDPVCRLEYYLLNLLKLYIT
jgi:hypothetical protein